MHDQWFSIWLISIIPILSYGFFEIEFLTTKYRWSLFAIYLLILWLIAIYRILT